ncbi:MAG: GNAT family N-acetyltransferase [Phycisphaerae bacterium]
MDIHIDTLVAEDIEPLHELYNQLVGRAPYHSRVRLAQFREDLQVPTFLEKPGIFLPAADIALVARRVMSGAERIVGLLLASATQEPAKFAPAHTGMIRFVMAQPSEDEACRLLIRAALEHLRKFAVTRISAMPYWYGPVFYNTGCGRLTGAWPWIGHALTREGFGVLEEYGTEIRMRKDIRTRVSGVVVWGGAGKEGNGKLRGEFPDGSELRRVPAFSRAGPDYEHWYDLYIGGQKAGECHALFGENFVRGRGHQTLDLCYLEVKEQFQGRGLGRIMLRETIAAAYEAGATEATLTTDATNFAAMNLYRSEGFDPIDLLFEFTLKDPTVVAGPDILPIKSW